MAPVLGARRYANACRYAAPNNRTATASQNVSSACRTVQSRARSHVCKTTRSVVRSSAVIDASGLKISLYDVHRVFMISATTEKTFNRRDVEIFFLSHT